MEPINKKEIYTAALVNFIVERDSNVTEVGYLQAVRRRLNDVKIENAGVINVISNNG
ncbi:hypothetical protein [Sphingobacterium corticis]|uniref:hypothetical protein n=1 Tax=Sphingobacterium corticis TaxID=1812823 RepID=UPI0036D27D10